jgi:hypothetical protein
MKPEWMKMAAGVALACAVAMSAQDRRTAIDVQSYRIEARIDPANGTVASTADITFTAMDSPAQSATFELHNGLNLLKVSDEQGRTLQTSRSIEDFTTRVNFNDPLVKGQPTKVRFEYEGRLVGQEESPIYGLYFAKILADRAWLLYPPRWFPVSGYTADRYTMELTVTVPDGFRVLAPGMEQAQGSTFTFKTAQPGFGGSMAVVKGSPFKQNSAGFGTEMWFATPSAVQNAKQWSEETGNVMSFLKDLYGVPPMANLTLVETGEGAPGGYSAPGMLFLSPGVLGKTPSTRILANQLSRQWFGNMISPVNRNHIWIANGTARYAEFLYLEHLNGAKGMDAEYKDLYVDALTVTDAPVRQAARFEDYSPEFFAITGSKGAATLHMLRAVMGDKGFNQMFKTITDEFANKQMGTDDFRKAAEKAYGQPLQGFFIQWLESTGAPEFKMEYTVFRTQKGFRVLGKITQDLDTFRMPVELRIETEGNPEEKRIDVSGPSTEFVVETFGKPKKVIIDPNGRLLRLSPSMRLAVAIRRGEQFAEIGDYNEALKEYQKALEVNRISSLAHYRVGEVFFLQGNYQSAANEFRESLNGDLDPKWTEVWGHINLGKIYDITQQRERATNEYQQAVRTKDNTQGAQEEAAKYLQTPYQRQNSN